MEYHAETKEAVLSELDSREAAGLSGEEVRERLERYGPNRLKEKKKKTIAARFFEQFKDVMILILLAAAAISFGIACIEGNPREFFEPALILLIVVLNAVMGVVQESKAERALDALKNLSAPHARVIRDGVEQIIEAQDLVPGDIIRLEAGDFIPADARLLHSVSLKSEESALTGESVPSEKFAQAEIPEKAPLGDRVNMVFTGCSITYGTATAVVTATGMQTEMGKIAGLLEGEGDGLTPLQLKLAQLGKYLGIIAIAACAIIFVVGFLNGLPPMELFMTAVSLAVAAIPEGLPATVTIVLAIGVQRMVKRNAIIRRLPAVETLGNASVICSDKTGTLTQNRMTLVKGFAQEEGILEAMDQSLSEPMSTLLKCATLCCDGSVTFEGDREIHIGDPTETAIVLAAHRHGMEKDALGKAYPRVAGLPFDSDRKLMTTVNQIDGKLVVITKGAFDVMAERCTSGDVDKGAEINRAMSADALRVLAVACRVLEELPGEITPETLERDLHFMGLVGMIDPPRPEAKAAVEVCRGAGIRPVMITGDHVLTASAIAKELGILREGDLAMTGVQLDALSDQELAERVTDISVYARVSPENKIRIVKAWQKRGEVVSMTGDGVNDAPALKAADIGCAMGITGTDVAKGASDMILTDDNFATIVEAVKEGRGIYANIKKVVGFLLGTNIGEVLAVLVAMVLWHKTPLLSMQLLWINLVTDSLPALALGVEPVEKDVMTQKPKSKTEGIFAQGFGVQIILQGLMFGILTLIAFRQGVEVTGQLAGGQTMAFLVLALSQVAHAFNMRSNRSLFATGFFTNSKLNLAALGSLVLTLLVAFTPLRVPFNLIALPGSLYFTALALILTPVFVMEAIKAAGFLRHRG
ncbi:MAG: cation transporting ATPase-like protein [Firmicutes bacterium]|nr:cation transporting ATPase-like protein [Bacillota bacterium]